MEFVDLDELTDTLSGLRHTDFEGGTENYQYYESLEQDYNLLHTALCRQKYIFTMSDEKPTPEYTRMFRKLLLHRDTIGNLMMGIRTRRRLVEEMLNDSDDEDIINVEDIDNMDDYFDVKTDILTYVTNDNMCN